MKKELSCRNFVVMDNGKIVEFENLSEEERCDFAERTGQKMAEAFQKYFSIHPEEFLNGTV